MADCLFRNRGSTTVLRTATSIQEWMSRYEFPTVLSGSLLNGCCAHSTPVLYRHHMQPIRAVWGMPLGATYSSLYTAHTGFYSLSQALR